MPSPKYSTAIEIFDVFNKCFFLFFFNLMKLQLPRSHTKSSLKLQRFVWMLISYVFYKSIFIFKGMCLFCILAFCSLGRQSFLWGCLRAAHYTDRWNDTGSVDAQTNVVFCMDLFIVCLFFLYPQILYLCFSLFSDTGVSHGDAVLCFGPYRRSLNHTWNSSFECVWEEMPPKKNTDPEHVFI